MIAVAMLSPGAPTGGWIEAPAPAVTFSARGRAVSNWRTEAARHLEAPYGTAAAILLGRESPSLARCVKLNNYWCIKRAGWAGEIAADAEGHVAFASAAEGADVAALLLRRYYVDFGRRSALAIVSRWAPPSCGSAPGAGGRGAADHLATRGIGRTLRARFLASRGRGAGRVRRSIVPDRLIGQAMPAPAIAVGMGEVPLRLAGGPDLKPFPMGVLLSASGPAGGASCTADDGRIRNYAARAAAGITASPNDDLKLFDANGLPTSNLARLLRNMAAVEIGPLGADKGLVAEAVARVAAAPVRPAAPLAAR